ncbi:MAG: hypothetical protein M0C28_29655 [Candidatus Moduliflexus flocculans]|nr:hypothetical protein [Candidatus Moduliflexus flocculans]
MLTLKYTVKAIAAKHGLIASFMPKPVFGINGSGMHCHQSFSTRRATTCSTMRTMNSISRRLAYSFIAGQLAHARALAAVVAPTVNSYKRLVPGYEAPVYIGWAQQNRSALIRIPRYTEGRDKAMRAELRFPDPSANPYLAFAAMLAAALDGIDKKMTPPKPLNNINLYHLDAKDAQENGRRRTARLAGRSAGRARARTRSPVDAMGRIAYETFVRSEDRRSGTEYRYPRHATTRSGEVLGDDDASWSAVSF